MRRVAAPAAEEPGSSDQAWPSPRKRRGRTVSVDRDFRVRVDPPRRNIIKDSQERAPECRSGLQTVLFKGVDCALRHLGDHRPKLFVELSSQTAGFLSAHGHLRSKAGVETARTQSGSPQ